MNLKAILILPVVAVLLTSFKPAIQSGDYDNYPVYSGNDLGVTWSPSKTTFKIWAPTARAVKLRLYAAGEGGKALYTILLSKEPNGVWQTVVNRNLKNTYYTFQANING